MKMTSVLLIASTSFAFSLEAATPSWKIVPHESTLVFTATQNNAPVKGKFTEFEGDIQFDPKQPESSKVTINVNTNSIDTSFKDIAETLKAADWLSTALFPKATFETTKITKQDDSHFEAIGNLTIRDKTIPTTMAFTLNEYDPKHAEVKGSASLKRTPFGIGQGEWSNTDEIKDDVIVDFTLKLVPVHQ